MKKSNNRHEAKSAMSVRRETGEQLRRRAAMNSGLARCFGAVLGLLLLPACSKEERFEKLLRKAENAREGKHYQEAIRDYSEAIRMKPSSVLAHYERGGLFVITGEFDKALEDLNLAIRLDPQNHASWEMRGHAYLGQQMPASAISDYTRALQLEPDIVRVIKARGQAYYQKRDYTNAIIDFTKALTISTTDPEVYHGRGAAYVMVGMTNEALADLSETIRLNPKAVGSLLQRAKLYESAGLYTNAVRDLSMIVEQRAKAAMAWNLLAWLLATCPEPQVRDGKRSVEFATKACELSSWTNYAYVDTLAAAYAETGDFDRAVKYQRQAASMGDLPGDNRTNVEDRIDLYLQHKPYRLSGRRYD